MCEGFGSDFTNPLARGLGAFYRLMMNCHESINLPVPQALWPEGKKPFSSEADGFFPRFTYYLPSEEYRSGQSMLVLPGGGYGLVSTAKEGHRPAQFLAAHGIACGVLEYRHHPQKHPVPLTDAQRAMRKLRSLAAQNGLDSDRIGVMGFSAGGHLAGCVATLPELPEGLCGDAVDAFSCKADCAVLVYPVVTLSKPVAHRGSANNLLGENPPPALLEQLSLENAVTKATGRMLLIHGQDDNAVPFQNSAMLYEALTKAGVPATLHLYEKAEHGFGLGKNHPWMNHLLEWLSAG
jgi:acetyl esterase/lipase